MIYAVNTGLIDANPASGVGMAFEKPKKQNMPTLRPEELPKLMRSLVMSNLSVSTRCLIEWQLLTLVRPSEASGARWAEIDLDAKLWTIPAQRMKAKREHIVPLSPQAIEILEVMKPISAHREHVFPSRDDPKQPMNSQTANAALKRIGYGGKLVAHGLRSIASTAMNEAGLNPDAIETALAHSEKNEVRRAYNRSTYLEQRVELMPWWGCTSPHYRKLQFNGMKMSASVHNPDTYMFDFRQLVTNGRKKIGILIGAGAPVSINIGQGEQYEPLIPNIEGLTKHVKQSLQPELLTIFEALEESPGKNNLEKILSDVRTLADIIGKHQVHGGDSQKYKELELAICSKIKEVVSKPLPEHQNPYSELISWINGINRIYGVEIFTTNYDLLCEDALERSQTPF